MSIAELQQAEVKTLMEQADNRFALLLFTPFCGTCHVAERMLEVVQAAGVPSPLYKCNINYAPLLRERFKITSVPCLLLLSGDQEIQAIYAVQSVDYLYKQLLAHA